MAEFETVWFQAADGVALNFRRLRRAAGSADRGPVLLAAGTGVRADLFSPPTRDTLPQYLSRNGYDVWMLNWRASIELPPMNYTIEDAAVLDYPPAVQTILEHTGSGAVKAVVHCQGATSFMMSVTAGLLPDVTTVVANAAALHPQIPTLTGLKMPLYLALLRPVLSEVNAQWAIHAPGFWPKVATWFMRAGHHECNNAVCKMISFIYSTKFPALWQHENISEATHEWIKGEFAQVPMTFFEHMQKCVAAGRLVTTGKYSEDVLPSDFVDKPPRTDARFVFMCGDLNNTFLPTGMARTFDHFEQYAPGRHTYQKMHGYGHLDVFIGERAAVDVFPFLLAELNRS